MGILLFLSSGLVPRPLEVISSIAYLICIIFALVCGLKNPGLELNMLTNQNEILKVFNDKKFCRVCEVIKEPETMHCIECDICIKKRVWHSIIIGKCIGEEVKIHFYIMIGAGVFIFTYIILLGFVVIFI